MTVDEAGQDRAVEPSDEANAVPPARSLHRLSVVAVCMVWPLIWVGSLVTTYDAGMAVPDWPGTYGYNLFLYPYESWFFGPFDLFIEHGHRLLGAMVGMVALAMVVLAFLFEPRIWVRLLAIGVLLAIASQGVLGGARVLLSDRTLAMAHGCLGPAVFALSVVMAVVTSRFWWRCRARSAPPRLGIGLIWLLAGLLMLAYVQLLLGAQIRHIQPNARPETFASLVSFHIVTALVLWAATVASWLGLRRCGDLTLSRQGLLLVGLLSAQLALGVGTWVVSYGWPTVLQGVPGSVDFLIRSKGYLDSLVVSAHVAIGALILAVSTLLLARTCRLRHAWSQPADGLPVAAEL